MTRRSLRRLPAATAAAALAAALVLGHGCRPARRPALAPGAVETGIASWYGAPFHGRPTSSREIYDMYDLTAAHPTLPMGTWVLVTSRETGKSAVVRVNDRGPFVKGRAIDLSYAAARLIGLVGPGTGPVTIEVLRRPPGAPEGVAFLVQAGAFADRAKAEALREDLERRYDGVRVTPVATPAGTFYRVRIGARDRAEAERTARRLADEGRPVLVIENRPGARAEEREAAQG